MNNSIKPTNGILLLNKPKGISSNKALQKVKHLYGIKKAGHTGSLDPLATGMLPLCFGEATKVCHYLLHADKCYQTTGMLGINTSTADAMGEVIHSVKDFDVSNSQLLEVINQFKGHSKQKPSMYSALKHQGTPLYAYARKGIEIERQPRDILISDLQLVAFDGIYFSLTVLCSKGTYIRNLVEDIGNVLGVGAHVTQLHRVYTGGFADSPMVCLEELMAMTEAERLNCMIPMDKAVLHLKALSLSEHEVFMLRQGREVSITIKVEESDCVRIYDKDGQFVGLGELQSNGYLKPKRLLAF